MERGWSYVRSGWGKLSWWAVSLVWASASPVSAEEAVAFGEAAEISCDIRQLALPDAMPPIEDMSGLGAEDLWLLADGTVYHYDGKRVRQGITPGCVSMEYRSGGAMPYNVARSDMDRAGARARRVGRPNSDEPRWVDFVRIVAEPGRAHLYGTGHRHYAPRGDTEVFGAVVTGNRQTCEGDFTYGELQAVAPTEDGPFFLTVIYGQTHLSGPLPGSERGLVDSAATYAGISASSSSDLWTWAAVGNGTLHQNGFTWELRPIPTLEQICRVVSLGRGQAAALGSLRANTGGSRGESARKSPDALALYRDERWLAVPLAGEQAPEHCAGFVAAPGGTFWVFSDAGHWLFWDGQRTHAVRGPAFQVTGACCGLDGVCFVAGTTQVPVTFGGAGAPVSQAVPQLYRVTRGSK